MKSIYRNMGERISVLIADHPITPNQITLSSNMFALMSLLIFHLFGDKGEIGVVEICFAIGLQCSLILDYTDGSLARRRKIVTEFGRFFDAFSDSFKLCMFFILAILKCETNFEETCVISLFLLFGFEQRILRNSLTKKIQSESNQVVDQGSNYSNKIRIITRTMMAILFGFSMVNIYLMLTLWLLSNQVLFLIVLIISGAGTISRKTHTAYLNSITFDLTKP